GLLADGFLAYEDGVPSTGSTSPLWAVALAAVHAAVPEAAGVDGIVRGTRILGVLLHLGLIATAASLATRLAGRAAGAAAGGLVALATPLAMAAFSGMEVGLAALLLTLGARDVVGNRWGRAGVWLGLAGLTRPEAGVVVVLALGFLAWRGPRGARGPAALRLLAGPVAAGAVFVGYDLWASGAPLPAAFYAKSSGSPADLPARLGRALTGLFPQVPPFAFGLGWLALLGLFRAGGPRSGATGERPWSRADRAWPAAAGGAFVLANVALIDPVDPAAFYHLRYVLPAVPLLLVGLAVGATALGGGRIPRAAPLVTLLALSVAGAAVTVRPVSRHFHNDVRNINEVQRSIGRHLGETLPGGTRIATSDAGAVRFFSELPTIDVTGLNTPEMRDASDGFLRRHPVAAIVLLPAWYRSPDADRLREVYRAVTEDYTVTSNERMAGQVVLALVAADTAPARLRFVGFHSFALDFVPWPAR
ncbi:MAG TPA: hypothetical protein VKU85_13635, partial [bacterium]|nr:hypothetical protein [bacterium]